MWLGNSSPMRNMDWYATRIKTSVQKTTIHSSACISWLKGPALKAILTYTSFHEGIQQVYARLEGGHLEKTRKIRIFREEWQRSKLSNQHITNDAWMWNIPFPHPTFVYSKPASTSSTLKMAWWSHLVFFWRTQRGCTALSLKWLRVSLWEEMSFPLSKDKKQEGSKDCKQKGLLALIAAVIVKQILVTDKPLVRAPIRQH